MLPSRRAPFTDAFPSDGDHINLLSTVRLDSAPKNLSSTKKQKLQRMGSIKNTLRPENSTVANAYLDECGDCFDFVFCRSTLMSRVRLEWTAPNGLGAEGVFGRTSYDKAYPIHQQIPFGVIRIDPFHEHESRWMTSGYGCFRRWYMDLCHAYITMFVHRRLFDVSKALQVFGIGGDGSAWATMLN